LIAVIPSRAAGLQLIPKSSRYTHDFGSGRRENDGRLAPLFANQFPPDPAIEPEDVDEDDVDGDEDDCCDENGPARKPDGA